MDQSIRNAVLRELVRISTLIWPITDAANIIYRGTNTGSPARRLMVDIQLTYGAKDWLDAVCDAAFLLDVAQAFCSNAETNTKPASFRKRRLQPADYRC